jgi:hypothetical protein
VAQEVEDFLEEVLTYKKELKVININQGVVVEAMGEVLTDQLLLIKGRILENKALEKLEKSKMKVKKNLIVEVDHKLHMKEEAEVKILKE